MEGAHAVIETLLVDVVTFDHLRQKAGDNPVSTEGFTDGYRLIDAHVSDRGCCIGEVLHVNRLQTSLENFDSKGD